MGQSTVDRWQHDGREDGTVFQARFPHSRVLAQHLSLIEELDAVRRDPPQFGSHGDPHVLNQHVQLTFHRDLFSCQPLHDQLDIGRALGSFAIGFSVPVAFASCFAGLSIACWWWRRD